MLIDGILLADGSNISKTVLDATKRGVAFPGSPSQGDVFELTELYNGKNPGIYTYNATDVDWISNSPDNSAVPYDVGGQVVGTMSSGTVLSRALAVRSFVIKIGFEGCLARSVVGATAQTTLSIKKISRQGTEATIGSIIFEAGNTVGTFSQVGSNPMYVTTGESLIVVAPTPADSTLADVSYTFAGSLA
jgi:hypothetical protein